MKTEVVCVSPDDSARVAAQKMAEANVGFLPVCDSSGKVLGTITDRDIAIRMVGKGLPLVTAVHQIMTPEVVCCRPDDDLGAAERLMGEKQKSRLLVIDGGDTLLGVISLSDLAQVDRNQAADVLSQIAARESAARPSGNGRRTDLGG